MYYLFNQITNLLLYFIIIIEDSSICYMICYCLNRIVKILKIRLDDRKIMLLTRLYKLKHLQIATKYKIYN